MGLILSHNLLLEGSNFQFAIPEYKRTFISPFYEQSYIIEMISDMNEDIRNSNAIFLEIYNSDFDALNEGARFDKILKAVNSIISAVIGAAKKAWKIIVELFNKAKRFILSKINDIKNKRPKDIEKLDKPTYVGILSKAIAEKSYSISIPSIKPTDRLLNPNFPKTKLDSMNRVDFMMHDLSNTVSNLKHMTDLSAAKNLTDSVAENLSEFRKAIGDELFSGYEFDVNNLSISADKVCEDAFGSKEIQSSPVSADLFLQADTNITNAKENTATGICLAYIAVPSIGSHTQT